MDKEHDIFISYSRKDSNLVLSIADKLSHDGYSVWIDKDGIESGDEFMSVIGEAIKNSKVFVFFSSYTANKSPWTVKEVNTAVHLHKTIIPVKLDNTEYNSSLLLALSGLDFINYENNPNLGMQRLLKSLAKHLGTGGRSLQHYNNDFNIPNTGFQSTSANQGDKTKNYMIIAAAVIITLVIGYFVFGNKADNKGTPAAVVTEQAATEENVSQTAESVEQTEPVSESRTQAPVVIVKEVRTETEPRRESRSESVTTASAASSVPTQTASQQTISEQTTATTATMSDAELVAQGKKAMRAMDYNTAKKSFIQAANHGSTEGNYQLGMLYSNSNYDGYNRETAASYFVKAASSNHVDAMYQAGMMYLGIDNSTAKLWLERAAAAGHSKAEAQLLRIK